MSIASRINEMTEHLRNDWGSIDKLGLDITEENSNDNLDKNIENIAPVLDRFYNQVSDKTNLSENGIVGRTSQDGDPTPENPVEINNLSGDVDYKIRGKNLFDKDTIINGYVNAGGGITNLDGYKSSAYIEIKPNASYYKSQSGSTRWKYYDENKNVYSSETTDLSNASNEQIFITPSNVKYLRFTMSNDLVDSFILCEGTTATTYEPYISESFPLSLKSRNLFDKNNKVYGKYYTSTGEIETDSGLFIQESYIKVEPNLEYTFSSKNNDYFRMCEYDINKTFIQRQIASNNTAAVSYTTTSTTEYIRVSCNNSNLATLQIEKANNLFVGYDNMQSGFLPQSGDYPTTNSSNPNAKYQLIELKQGESVVTGGSTSVLGRIRCIDKSTNKVVNTIINTENSYYISTSNYTSNFASGTITAKKDIILGVMILNSTFSSNFIISKISPYEPYYDIELCNISDYKDQIYSQNGGFYLEKKTGKSILNGSENWLVGQYGTNSYGIKIAGMKPSENNVTNPIYLIANLFKGISYDDRTTGSNIAYSETTSSNTSLYIRNTNYTSITNFKAMLETTNLIVYYVLTTTTTTEITEENYPTLYSQLLAIQEFLTKYKINKEFLLDYSSPEIEY